MRRIKGHAVILIKINFAVRDPFGVRPFCLGRINGYWVVASESCALDHIGAVFSRDIEPGEIVEIDSNGPKSYYEKSDKQATCVFEYIYFARPDSTIDGKLVYSARMAMGAQLAKNIRCRSGWLDIRTRLSPASAILRNQESRRRQ
jgi:amidophosphoribosyltransferase